MLIKKVRDYIEKNQMLRAGDKVIAAVSGGADSVCLLYILVKLREELKIDLRAVHVHHGLRGHEADMDATYTRELCGKLDVTCVVEYCDVKTYAKKQRMSTEEAGRTLRYQTFDRECDTWGADKIAVAHHGDDVVETILHNLFRGSGLKGLGGIAPVRGNIIRPLLCVNKQEILGFLSSVDLGFCEDSTNAFNDYTRNVLRNEVMPLIVTQINDGAAGNILHAGKLISQADAYLEKRAGQILQESGICQEGRIGIPVSILIAQDSIIQTYLIMQMIRCLGTPWKDITSSHIEQTQQLLLKPVGRKINLPYALTAVRGYEQLWIETGEMRRDVDNSSVNQPFSITKTIFPYEKGMEIPKNQYTKWFDYDKIKGTLSVRVRDAGDYITLPSGGRKTVKAYMIDEKIPRKDRDCIPLLAEDHHILWIIGYRISEYYKVTEHTKTVLQTQFNGGRDDGR